MSEITNKINPLPAVDKSGNYSYVMMTGRTESNLKAVCYKMPDHVIPVIFIPGVMGTNLKSKQQKYIVPGDLWRLDSPGTLAWWLGRGAVMRRNLLSPDVSEVDDGGVIEQEGATDNALFPSRRQRGWGEVANMSYGSFLVWLQNALNDFEHCQGESETA